ncbi:MAG: DsbA family protein [Minisyncoccia bacterium]
MEDNNKLSQNFLAISILIAAILISGSIFYTKGNNNKAQEVKPQNQEKQLAQVGQLDLAEVLKINSNDVILGDPKAPITLIEYSDYQCPFCEKFFNESEMLLRKEFIETGKVKMIYRDFPLPGHPYAQPAALAANCAKDQGKFWTYHDVIFQKQNELANLDYVKIAEDLKMNTKDFKQCLDSKKYQDKIKKDYENGVKIGVNGTPTFFLNGKQIVGAQPYEVFKSAIESELNK